MAQLDYGQMTLFLPGGLFGEGVPCFLSERNIWWHREEGGGVAVVAVRR